MSAVLEFNLVCSEHVDLYNAMQIIIDCGHSIEIKEIYSIDNWEWANQHKLLNILESEQKLMEGKIIIIKFETEKLKDVGLFIEKVDNDYLYTLWLNTHECFKLDPDIISTNSKYYEISYNILQALVKHNVIAFKVLAIGEETLFKYDAKDIKRMISSSRNVFIWVINKKLYVGFNLPKHQKQEIDELGVCVFIKQFY